MVTHDLTLSYDLELEKHGTRAASLLLRRRAVSLQTNTLTSRPIRTDPQVGIFQEIRPKFAGCLAIKPRFVVSSW